MLILLSKKASQQLSIIALVLRRRIFNQLFHCTQLLLDISLSVTQSFVSVYPKEHRKIKELKKENVQIDIRFAFSNLQRS